MADVDFDNFLITRIKSEDEKLNLLNIQKPKASTYKNLYFSKPP